MPRRSARSGSSRRRAAATARRARATTQTTHRAARAHPERYPDFLRTHYAERPELAERPYAEQLQSLLDRRFGTSDAYSHHLRELGHERGDIKYLEGPLRDYLRLRVRDFRIIFQYSRQRRVIECVFAERRDLIYEVFEKLIHARLLGESEK